ncbi:caspase-8-like [Hoplias malabaricus]|uniref:caspase-8-like n=1 Tax=Hoplias malabaricus TaxID=27720 RepID=UPI0034621F8A
MQTLRDQKVFFIDTLSADAKFVLQHVQEKQIITKREYNNLNHDNYTNEKIVTDLIDKVMNKGNETCLKFLQLLQNEQLQESFPALKKHFTPLPLPALSNDNSSPADEMNEYKMSSDPCGICVIFNNVNFIPGFKERKGSDRDEESLKYVFNRLKFTVEVYKDRTAQQMRDDLKRLSQTPHTGDCFVCCILSHGCSEGVHGTDGGIIKNEEIFGPFKGTSCPSLASKPKVFFIQACRGEEYQLPFEIEADNLEVDEAEEEAEYEMDMVKMISIPADADFLVARSTVKGFFSLRNILSGSWFIQSLCKQLEHHCPKSEDVLSILTCVNREVSRQAANVMVRQRRITAKQMPVQKVTLRKKLVFPVPR